MCNLVLGFWFTSQHFYMKYMYLRMLNTKLWDRYRYIIHKILGVCSLNFFNGFIASDTVRVQRRYKITLKDNNTCTSQLLESWSLSLGGGLYWLLTDTLHVSLKKTKLRNKAWWQSFTINIMSAVILQTGSLVWERFFCRWPN